MKHPSGSYVRICYSVFIILICLFTFSIGAKAQPWEKPYAGNDPALLYYPDQNAVYLRYGWQNNKNGILIIKGKLPKARYFSYNLYDDSTKGSVALIGFK